MPLRSLTLAPPGQADPRVSVTTSTMASGSSGPHCSDPVPNRYPSAGGRVEGVAREAHGTCPDRLGAWWTRRPWRVGTPATPATPDPSIHTPGGLGDFVLLPHFRLFGFRSCLRVSLLGGSSGGSPPVFGGVFGLPWNAGQVGPWAAASLCSGSLHRQYVAGLTGSMLPVASDRGCIVLLCSVSRSS